MLKSATRVLNNEGVAVPLGADQRAELEATITQVRKLPLRPGLVTSSLLHHRCAAPAILPS